MELITTYPAAVNSKATVTMGVLDQATTIVEVLDATVLPEAPNLLVLGTDQTAETVLMTARENNTLTIQRAVQGIAKSWPAGTQIARNFTAKDWDDMRSNVEAIVTKILGLTASDVGALPNNQPVPIDKGGTGATTAEQARINLGVPSTASDVGALPLDGSVPMSGKLRSTKKGGTIGMDSSDSVMRIDGGTSYNDGAFLSLHGVNENSNDKGAFQLVANGDKRIQLRGHVDGTLKWNNGNIFGEHNKPSGSYTGNGSATERKIATGGLGSVIAIFAGNGSYWGIASRHGGVFFPNVTNGTIKVFDGCIYFYEGSLAMVSNSTVFNASGVTYNYQVL